MLSVAPAAESFLGLPQSGGRTDVGAAGLGRQRVRVHVAAGMFGEDFLRDALFGVVARVHEKQQTAVVELIFEIGGVAVVDEIAEHAAEKGPGFAADHAHAERRDERRAAREERSAGSERSDGREASRITVFLLSKAR